MLSMVTNASHTHTEREGEGRHRNSESPPRRSHHHRGLCLVRLRRSFCSKMSTESGELLGIDPVELRFPFVPSCIVHSFPDFLSSLNQAVELNKQISYTLQLTNKTDKQVAFKVKRILLCAFPGRRSHAKQNVTMQAQRDAPPDMHCKDKFLVQSAIVAKEIMPKEVTGDMFTKDSGNIVDEVKLKVVYTAPSSSQNEGFEDGNLDSLSYQEETKEPKESDKIISEVNLFYINIVKLYLLKILGVVLSHLKYSYLKSDQICSVGNPFA
ncbi:Vesicle-associated protein 1-2 [Zea mays]|uniref:Vesicle-associated protein 1-2 n=1 Tax=Zea mays TaxID=4577 RepID=A0A3L6F3M5_MAIZE|nr:Vesicle-associated protein 1-2 [Zea mays]